MTALPTRAALQTALTAARKEDNGGLNLDMWGVIVNRAGIVRAVAYTGAHEGDQWPGSRAIAAAKAFTANAFSLDTLALATAHLYTGSQPGGFLWGLANGNPLDTALAYAGDAATFGTDKDPMVGHRVGGTITFGGGLALYDKQGKVVGGLGVSGDTSPADHNIVWRTRHLLELDYVTSGPNQPNDQALYDITLGISASGFGHPTGAGTEHKIAKNLPDTRKPGK